MCATVSTALAKLSIKLIDMLKPNTGHHKQVYRIMVESMSGNMKCVCYSFAAPSGYIFMT